MPRFPEGRIFWLLGGAVLRSSFRIATVPGHRLAFVGTLSQKAASTQDIPNALPMALGLGVL